MPEAMGDWLVPKLIAEFWRSRAEEPQQLLPVEDFVEFCDRWLSSYVLIPNQSVNRVRVRLEPDANLTLVVTAAGGEELFSIPLRRPRDSRGPVDESVVLVEGLGRSG